MNPFAPKFARSRRDVLAPTPDKSTVDTPAGDSGKTIVETPKDEKPKRAKAPRSLRRTPTARKGKGKTA